MAEVVKKNLFFSREKYKVFLSFMGKECYNNYQKIARESKDPCGSRQMDMQACPLGSLLAGIKRLTENLERRHGYGIRSKDV